MPQQLDTHLVDNQPPPLVNYNLFSLDMFISDPESAELVNVVAVFIAQDIASTIVLI